MTVNDARYRGMSQDFFWQEVNAIDINDKRFQQNSVTSRTACETMAPVQTGQ